MAPISSTEMFTNDQQQRLLDLAVASIEHGLDHGTPLEPHLDEFEPALQAHGACFVTLKMAGELRGCIGSLAAYRPLVEDVAHNAYAAAFSDPRFYPLQRMELLGLQLDISVLSEAQPMRFTSEEDLLSQLQPGVDGLILEEGYHRGTFLPSVWEQLPEPRLFLQHLKRKAGLPENHWSQGLTISRYHTVSFGRQLPK